MEVRIFQAVLTKVSRTRFVHPGLVGPKARPKGVVDGKQVNIPVPIHEWWSDGEGYCSPVIGFRVKCQVLQVGKSACCNGEARIRVNPQGSSEAAYIMLPRKASSLSLYWPYRERTHVVKESILRLAS